MPKHPPKTLRQFQQAFPEVWRAYERLRETCGRAGPLDRKTAELIRVAVEVARQRHGGLIAHIHRAQASGATREEIFQALLLALPLIGFPDALESFQVAQETLAG